MAPRHALELVDARDPMVETVWRRLEAQARPCYFLTWSWVENWISTLPVDEVPPLAVVMEDDVPSAACFVGRRRVRRHFLLPSNACYFNATGSPRRDGLGIAHNALLAVPGASRSLATLLELLPPHWDELYLPAIDRYAFDDLGASRAGARPGRYRICVDRESAAPFVDLDAVRGVPGGHAALLPANVRTQLDRARQLTGELELEIAADELQAFDIYGELLRLQARRAYRGGAVADPWIERFHRRLIQRRLAHGEIQLARVRTGGTTIGCLYNLVANGRVISYRAGFDRLANAQLRPSYQCHAAAVEYNALAGHETYDLTRARVEDHVLATGMNRLVWLRVQRPLARFALEHELRRLTRWLEAMPPRLALRPG